MYECVKVTKDGKEKFVFIAAEGNNGVAFFADQRQSVVEGHRVEGLISNFGYNNNLITFLADSGANEYACNQKGSLSNFVKLVNATNVQSTNKESKANLKIEYNGELHMKDDNGEPIVIKNILNHPNFIYNLFSLRKLIIMVQTFC